MSRMKLMAFTLLSILAMVIIFIQVRLLYDYWDNREYLRWSVRFGEPVALRIDGDIRYQPDSVEGKGEFALLLPSGQHLVRLPSKSKDSEPEVYTVMLFHQLRCLDIIREDYTKIGISGRSSPLARHCLNYLRQTILCHADLRLESVRRSEGQKPTTTREYEAVCRDWSSVYEEAEKNYEAFNRYLSRLKSLNIRIS